jgi:ABC-2 type transport system permease protein
MNILRIVAWDLRRVGKDWMAAVWMLAMPLVMAFVFGSAMRNNGPQTTWVPVIDLDQHELSAIFIEQLRQDGYYIEIKSPESQQDLKKNWPYGIVIPAGFGDAVLKGQQVKISFVKGSAPQDKILQVQSLLTHAIIRFTKGLALADLSQRPWDEKSRTALQDALARPQLLTVAQRNYRTLRPPPAGFNQSLPGMLVMFVMQMVLTYGGTALVSDRLGGQLRRLLVMPLRRFEPHAAKVLARLLLAFVQAVLMLAGGSLLFHIPLGDHPLFLLPVILCLAAFAGCLSMLGGMLCRTEKQVILVAIFSAMVMSALGGCWWPIEIVPSSFKVIAMLMPSYWAMHGLQSVMYFGRSYEVLTFECPILLGFALLFGALALLAARMVNRRGGAETA